MFSPSSGPGLPSWQERDVGLSADIRDVRSSHTSSSLSEAMNVSMILPQVAPGKESQGPDSTFLTGEGSGGVGGWGGGRQGGLNTRHRSCLSNKRPRHTRQTTAEYSSKSQREATAALSETGWSGLLSHGEKCPIGNCPGHSELSEFVQSINIYG